MPDYQVTCGFCASHHESGPYNILEIVLRCKICGDDVCPNCCDKVEKKFHSECIENSIESEEI